MTSVYDMEILHFVQYDCLVFAKISESLFYNTLRIVVRIYRLGYILGWNLQYEVRSLSCLDP